MSTIQKTDRGYELVLETGSVPLDFEEVESILFMADLAYGMGEITLDARSLIYQHCAGIILAFRQEVRK